MTKELDGAIAAILKARSELVRAGIEGDVQLVVSPETMMAIERLAPPGGIDLPAKEDLRDRRERVTIMGATVVVEGATASHPFPWRQGDQTKAERPWVVLDARGSVVVDCCDDDFKQTMEQACQRAKAIVSHTQTT